MNAPHYLGPNIVCRVMKRASDMQVVEGVRHLPSPLLSHGCKERAASRSVRRCRRSDRPTQVVHRTS